MQSLLKRKELIYMVFRRYPVEMQENLDNGNFMEPSGAWRKAVEYYWERRYNTLIKAKSTTFYRNYVTRFGIYIKCSECERPFSAESEVAVCWRCRKYTCWDCNTPTNSAVYYCACNRHRKECMKCNKPFIPYSTNNFEVYCFPCQHSTGMYDQMWQTIPRNEKLPYGTIEMRRTFEQYLKSLQHGPQNDNIVIGADLYGTYNVAIGTHAGIAIGTAAVAIGGGARGGPQNDNNNNHHVWDEDYEYYSDDDRN